MNDTEWFYYIRALQQVIKDFENGDISKSQVAEFVANIAKNLNSLVNYNKDTT